MRDFKNYAYSILLVITFALGVALRLKVLLLGHGFQTDEANLALNLIDRNYLQLFLPLNHFQVAPPFFLILSKFVYSSVHSNIPYISDLLFRLLPFISGVLAIPVFGYLLNLLFRNKIINLIGMFSISIVPTVISYSCIFKQYSTEMLVLMLMLIAFLKIDFSSKSKLKNILLMTALGLAPFFSMTAVFVYPGGFLYLILKNIKTKDFMKNFCPCIIPFAFLFLVYVIVSLYPVCQTHYAGMCEYWKSDVSKNVFGFMQTMFDSLFRTKSLFISTSNADYKVLPIILFFFAGLILFLKNNYKQLILCAFPILTTYIFFCFNSYPLEERFFVFLTPCVLLICLYPLLPLVTNKKSAVFILSVFSVFVFNYIFHLNSAWVLVIHKPAVPSVQIWDYWKTHYKKDGDIILSDSVSLGQYYYRLYSDNSVKCTALSDNKISKGTHYLIITSFYSKGKKEVENLKKSNIKIIDEQIFAVPTSTDYIRKSYYLKFVKP